jgi:hypothetical protein
MTYRKALDIDLDTLVQLRVEFVKQSARDEGISRLVLNATEMGYGLYKRAGFSEPELAYMRLEL